MSNVQEEHKGTSDSGSKFHTVQPLRDLESNWTVNLAKQLQEYLIKICSGEITGEDDGRLSVNFAEAALLLQGSIQVYSRKVEYLYSLVLHALEFISHQSQHHQPESTSPQQQEVGSSSNVQPEDESDPFWGLDDIPVEVKNSLDSPTCRDPTYSDFVKPPANLVVLEGDCFDAIGDGGELESYLLATNDLYRDFILLDSCDSAAVDTFLNSDEKACKLQNGVGKGSSLNSKSRKSFQSPGNRSGGTACKPSIGKSHDAKSGQSPGVYRGSDHENIESSFPANFGPECDHDGFSQPMGFDDDDMDEDDPWKPLNPYEPGNLKVKPFKKVNTCQVNEKVTSSKWNCLVSEFPLARLDGIISSEFSEMWGLKGHHMDRRKEASSPPLFEMLRQSLVLGASMNYDAFRDALDENEDHEYDGDHDFGSPEFDLTENACVSEEIPSQSKEHDNGRHQFNKDESSGYKDPIDQQSLEDLCESHLDSLLASIAETEKQTELATRVSTWKQKIEKDLDEQDSRPSFDIHQYGGRILDKLSSSTSAGGDVMSFADVVKGQKKHDVARTFSALLQLVNNRDVDLERMNSKADLICYTVENPFHVRLLRKDKIREEMQLRSSKKRSKSPLYKEHKKGGRTRSGKENSPAALSSPTEYASPSNSPKSSSKYSLKLRKSGGIRCASSSKRRRSSRILESVSLYSAG